MSNYSIEQKLPFYILCNVVRFIHVIKITVRTEMYFKNDKKDFFLSFSKLFTEGILLTVGKLPFVNF